MVDPNHQRKGIGMELLKTVAEQSDKDGVPTFLVASAEAHRMYAKLGFKELGLFEIDNEYWSKEIVKLEQELGFDGNENMALQFRGIKEVERCMVRWKR